MTSPRNFVILAVLCAVLQACCLVQASLFARHTLTKNILSPEDLTEADSDTLPLLDTTSSSASTAVDSNGSLKKRKEGELVCGPSSQNWKPASRLGLYMGLRTLSRGPPKTWVPHGCTQLACFANSAIVVCNDGQSKMYLTQDITALGSIFTDHCEPRYGRQYGSGETREINVIVAHGDCPR